MESRESERENETREEREREREREWRREIRGNGRRVGGGFAGAEYLVGWWWWREWRAVGSPGWALVQAEDNWVMAQKGTETQAVPPSPTVVY